MKLLSRLPHFFNSVFTKLLLVLVITGLCINLMVGSFFRQIFHDGSKLPWKVHLNHYISYIIDGFGTPPSLAKAKEFSEKFFIEIRYEGSNLQWETANIFPSLHQLVLHQDRNFPNIKFGHLEHQFWHTKRNRKNHFLIVQHGDGQFIATLSRKKPFRFISEEFVVLLILSLTAVLVGSFLAIRWILRPITWLSKGVQEVSEGNLDYQVPAGKKDELGQLATAFNSMTEQIQRMLRAKEQLLLDVSHELRSPVTRIKVALEFMEPGKIKDKIQEDVNDIEQMVSEILENARLKSEYGNLQQTPANLVEILKQSVQTAKKDFQKIESDIPFDEVLINIDIPRVQTVFRNLLSNAMKYSEQSSIEVRMLKKEGYVIVEIQDQGAGIPEKELSYIFEPFYRVDKSRSKNTGGYGLGLNLCKTIMNAHQGKIEVTSELGHGTTISLFFPMKLNQPSV